MLKKIAILVGLVFASYYGFSQTITPGTRSNRETGTYYDMTSFDSSPFEDYTFDGVVDTFKSWINFRMLKPKNYSVSNTERYPLIVFFHGAGEGGRAPYSGDAFDLTDPRYDNNDYHLIHGGQPFMNAKNSNKFPGFVLFAQNDYRSWGNSGEGSEPLSRNIAKVIELIETMVRDYNVDPFRIYVNGLSNGGLATWAAVYNRPDLFAAVAPMSAKGDTSMIPVIGSTPLWIFQGGMDANPSQYLSDFMYAETKKRGGDIRYTLYPEVGHDTWNYAWAEPDFFSWLLSKRKNDIHVWGGDSTICLGGSVKLGVAAGLDEYLWSNGATTNEIVVNAPGTFTLKIRRGTIWSDWSKPVEIKYKTTTPSAIIRPSQSLYIPSIAGVSVVLSTSLAYEKYVWSTGATTPTITVSTPGAYSVNVTAEDKCPSSSVIPVNVISAGTNVVGRPITPINIVAAAVSESSIKVNWSDNNTTETGVEIFRSTVSGSGYRYIATVPANSTEFVNVGLAGSTNYYYKIRAVNEVGASNTSVVGTLARTLDDNNPPSMPGNLTVTNGLTATLNWESSVDNIAVAKYLIYRNGVLLDSTVNTTYTTAKLNAGTRYTFYVYAKDLSKNLSQSSNQVSIVTPNGGMVDYSFYTGSWNSMPDFATLTPTSTGQVNNFNLSPRTQNDYFAVKFQGYLKIKVAGAYTFFTKSDDGSKLYIGGFSESNLLVNNNYLQGPTERSNATKKSLAIGYYPIYVTYFEKTGGEFLEVKYSAVKITNGVPTATSVLSKQFIPDSLLSRTIPPSVSDVPKVPTSISVQQTIGSPSVLTTWSSFSSTYKTEIYRSISASTDFVLIKTADEGITTYTDASIEQNIRYYYKFRSISINGESPFSANYSLIVSGFPLAVTELRTTSFDHQNVNLSWNDNSDNETAFIIERKIGNAAFATVATVPSNSVSFTDIISIPGITYTYRVVARNALGKASPSNELIVKVPLPAIAYQGDWKMAALQVIDSYALPELVQALLNKEDFLAKTSITAASTRTITMQLPAMTEGGMMIYNIENGIATSLVKLFTSSNSTNGTDGTWAEVVGNYVTDRNDDLQKIDLPVSTASKWYRAQFTNNGTASIVLKELGLYAFKPNVRHNYILLLGASIEEIAGGFTDFKNEILAQFPGTQPVVFNLAESGTNAQGLSTELQSILDRHPKAGYVMIHQGGNNISQIRPLTYDKLGSYQVLNDFLGYLQNIIVRCKDAGKITVHARISFRDYKVDPKVNDGKNQEFGSLPYNLLLDKITKQQTPEFYDTLERRPRMDLYEFTLNNQSVLNNDGIHPKTGMGYLYVRRWVSSPIRYFYTGTFPEPTPYTEYRPNLRIDASNAVINAEISHTPEDIFNARILVDQIGDRAVRIPLHVRLDNIEAGIYPAVPDAPSSLVVSSTINSANLSWTDNSSNETYYKILKSVGDTSNYQVVTTYLPENTTSYVDNGLNAHTTYHYKVLAGNSGGASEALITSTTTLNTTPVLGSLGIQQLIKGRTYNVTIPYTDADGDVPVYALSNVPAFASIVGNKLVMNPATSDIGTYNDVVISANDGFGGIISSTCTIIVSSENKVPVITYVSDKMMYEMETSEFVVTAIDDDNDSLTWTKVSGPAFATVANLGGGKMKVSLKPSLSDAGNYSLITKVVDTKNANVFDTLLVVVEDMQTMVIYRINAGGSAITASPINWLADKLPISVSYFDPASASSTGGSATFPTSYSNNTSAPRTVFGPYRIDPLTANKAAIQYKFPTTNSKYVVNLFFAEPGNIANPAVGKRVFHINIEGNRVLSNFDPFAEAGMNAIQKQFVVNVTDGMLNLILERHLDKPVISGIEIIKIMPYVLDRRGEIESEASAESLEVLQLVPNPVEDVTHLRGLSELNTGEGQIKVSVVNEIGNIVWSKEANSSTISSDMEISFRDMASGFYILKVEMPNGKPFVKTIIKK